jgi:hypothetical protein
LTPNDRYGAYALLIDRGKEMKHGEGAGSVCGSVDVVVEVVAYRIWKVAGGGVFWPAKCRTEPYGLGFVPGGTNQKTNTRERVWGGIDVVVEVVVCCVGKIAGGVRFGLQNAKPSRTDSVLVWGAQTKMGALEGVCWVRGTLLLMR